MYHFEVICEMDNWIVEFDKDSNMYRVSYFKDNHFVDQCFFDAIEQE